jgi:hypothetical protein
MAAFSPAATMAAKPHTAQTVQLTVIKVLCPSYTVVPSNKTPALFDETGGKYVAEDTSYQTVLTNPATDIPGICTLADGWDFQMFGDPGVSVPVGTPITTGADGAGTGATTISLDPTEIALAQTTGAPTGLWISEVKQPAVAAFGALRCFNDMSNGDNRENVQGIGSSSLHIYCISYDVLPPTTYHALADPTRILNTRDGTGGVTGPIASKSAKTFQVTGGVVPAGATAVTGNLTVTGQTSAGFLYIGPQATNNPTSSTLNFPVGDNRANAVTVGLGTGGKLSFTFVGHAGAHAHVIFDVTGYFTPNNTGATYHALTPARLLNTRDGTGGITGPIAIHSPKTFQVTGGVVPTGAVAVTGNLTVTGQTGAGYLFIGPVATVNPTSSTLNFPVGDNRANAVTVGLGAGGTLSFTYVAHAGSVAHVIFDVTGYFTADLTGAFFVPLTPARILDTRNTTGGVTGPVGPHSPKTFPVTGAGRVDAAAVAVTGNLTVTGQTGAGYLFLGPASTVNPTSSTLNFPVGDTRANAATVGLGGGALWFTFVGHPGTKTQALFDVSGYFTP